MTETSRVDPLVKRLSYLADDMYHYAPDARFDKSELVGEAKARIEALTAQLAEDADARTQIDHRLEELVGQVAALTADNARLRGALDAAFPIVRKAFVAAKMDAVNASPSDPTALQREAWMKKCAAALELVVIARAALTGKETK
jgi:hypothetical protein